MRQRPNHRQRGACVALFASLALVANAYSADFEKQIAPILIKRCLECHSTAEASGKLVLVDWESVQRGGESGRVIVPGQPHASRLLERVAHGEMPPEKQGRSQQLPADEIAALKSWIAKGAPWPKGRVLDLYEKTSDVRAGRDWWSLQPIRQVVPPADPFAKRDSASKAPSASAIDAFIGHELARHGLEPAPPADRPAILRRLYFDLVGMPPTAVEIESFARDTSPNAYETRVDKLLASPHFGERWGRHWLDLARFAETCGYERDQEKKFAWKYRDWVVRSLNDDKPYDRFVLEQLAGDELPDRSIDTVIGTGFLRLGTWNDEPNDPQEYKYERIEDLVHAAGAAFLGMTIKCARCHDHKFDPIPQLDYYRVANAFWPGPIEPRAAELLGGPTSAELGADVLGWTDIRRPPPLFAMKKGDPRRPTVPVPPGHLTLVAGMAGMVVDAPATSKTTGRRLQLAKWIVDPRNPLTARVYVNRLWQGHFGQGLVRTPDNFGHKGDLPTHPHLLDWLATQLTQGGWRSKPLHKAIVMSRTYRQSTVHPKFNAYQHVDAANRWRWRADRKRLEAEALRDAMLTASGKIDLRLGGPSFRPTIAAEATEGLSKKSAAWKPSPTAEQNRRSLYIYTQRSLLPPMLTTFDFCDTTLPCGQRDVSTVAPQALALLNNRFVVEQSNALADRVANSLADARFQHPSAYDDAAIRAAWRFALSRDPTPAESASAMQHCTVQRKSFAAMANHKAEASRLALASLCHVLLNTNEFIYVD